jgi:hypothetical protein
MKRDPFGTYIETTTLGETVREPAALNLTRPHNYTEHLPERRRMMQA